MSSILRQGDPRWGALEIIPGMTMSKSGCLITCECAIADILPDAGLELLKKANAINLEGSLIHPEGSLIHPTDAKALNLDYFGIVTKNPNKQCVCETNKYKDEGYPQHFYVQLNNGMIMDPLTGTVSTNKYLNTTVSFRLYAKKQNGTQSG
jgi:hypothetical protein